MIKCDRLKAARETAGMSLAQSARFSGVNITSVRRLEIADCDATHLMLGYLAVTYGVSIGYLIGETDDPNRYIPGMADPAVMRARLLALRQGRKRAWDAVHIGISHDTLYDLERGGSVIAKLSSLEKIARYHNVRIGYLIGEHADDSPVVPSELPLWD